MMMTLHEAAQATNGRVLNEVAHQAVEFDGVGTDTRRSLAGQLYIALRGERFDGHAFVTQAFEQGATAAMVEKGMSCEVPEGFPLLEVADTRLALGALASWWRSKFNIPVIGVTGSNGKTTVKEMCAAILRAWMVQEGEDPITSVLATQGNLNNDIGLPQMMLQLRPAHRAAVFEMGMNRPGEIAYLGSLAKPTVAIVNNAQRAHLEGMGELSEVAREKGSLYGALGAQGVAVINADDLFAEDWVQMASGHKTILFGLKAQAEVWATYTQHAMGFHIDLHALTGTIAFDLQVPGLHNVRNALAAAAATLAAGVPLSAIARGLSAYTGVKGRLQKRMTASGAVLFDDTYNANPDSVRAGIDVLASMPGKKIFVLGDMGEIGDMSAQYHDEVGGYAKSQGIDYLFALGDSSAIAVHNFGSGGEHFRRVEDLVSALQKLLDKDTVVLVKGSRFMKMERISDAIASDQSNV